MATDVATTSKLSGAALVAALFVVAVWLGMLIWLVAHSDATEVTWARWLTVMASLEAVAFAAAGAVFGTTVQSQRVTEAKEQAAAASDRAVHAENASKENSKDAANGRALAMVVKTRKRKKSASTEGLAGTPGDDADDDLAAIAERLFPD
jgi:ribosomal protein S15P/S13E